MRRSWQRGVSGGEADPGNGILLENGDWLALETSDTLALELVVAPVVTGGQVFTIIENCSIGTTVGTVLTTGGTPDSFAITAGNTGTRLAINSVGIITTIAAIDYEVTASYSLTVQATNSGGSHSNTQTVNVTNMIVPVVTASQAFSVNENVALSTVVGTVLTTGGTPGSFAITAGNTANALRIDEAGVIRTDNTIDYETLTIYNLTITATNAEGASAGVAVTVNVNDLAESPFSAETGDNLVVGMTVWAATTALGASVTVGSITGWFRTNASKLYYASGGGTTGSTAPTHSTGSASDGTISWLYCCPVDYTTHAGAIAGLVALGTFTAARNLILWANAETTNATAPVYTGIGTTSAFQLTIKAKEELSFYSAASPTLRYNTAKGVSIRSTGNYEHGLVINNTYVTLKGLQVCGPNGGGGRSAVWASGAGTGCIFDRCIFEGRDDGNDGYIIRSEGGLIRNCVLVKDDAGTTRSGVNNFGVNLTMANCTLARPSNHAAGGAAFGTVHANITIKNCTVAGFTVAPSGTVTGSYTASTNATSVPSGAGDVTITTYANEFVQSSAAGGVHDFRLVTGAVSKNAGTADTTNIPDGKDILGATRSAWDIGAHEFA